MIDVDMNAFDSRAAALAHSPDGGQLLLDSRDLARALGTNPRDGLRLVRDLIADGVPHITLHGSPRFDGPTVRDWLKARMRPHAGRPVAAAGSGAPPARSRPRPASPPTTPRPSPRPAPAAAPPATSSDARVLGCAWLAIGLGRRLTDGDRAALVEYGVLLRRDPSRAEVAALARQILERDRERAQTDERARVCAEMDRGMGLARSPARVERTDAGAVFHVAHGRGPSSSSSPAPLAPPRQDSPDTEAMDIAMGIVPASRRGVRRTAQGMVFGHVTPEEARKALDKH